MNKTKVLCLSGSLRAEASNSEKMLQLLMRYIREFGGEPTLIRLAEKNIIACEGCYSKTRDGSKCTYPCIHDGKDDTQEVLRAIIASDAIAISTGVYWAGPSSLVQKLLEKMTAIENNERQIGESIGREPLSGKPFVLLASQEGEGASMALSQISWALSHMGFIFLPYGGIYKPALLERKLARVGLRLLNERKFEWIDNTIRLAVKNLVEIPRRLEGFSFDDRQVQEPRC